MVDMVGGGLYIRSLNEHNYIQYTVIVQDNEQDIHMTSGNYEANGYGHDSDL